MTVAEIKFERCWLEGKFKGEAEACPETAEQKIQKIVNLEGSKNEMETLGNSDVRWAWKGYRVLRKM